MVLRAKRVKGTNGIFGHNDYIHDTGKLKKSKTNYINGHVNLMYKVPNWLYTSGLIPICTHMLRMFATFSVCIYTSTWIDAYILRVKKNQCGSVCYGQQNPCMLFFVLILSICHLHHLRILSTPLTIKFIFILSCFYCPIGQNFLFIMDSQTGRSVESRKLCYLLFLPFLGNCLGNLKYI